MFIYRVLRTLNFLEEEGVWAPIFFWSHQFWRQKIFIIFSFTKSSGHWIFWGRWGSGTFFGHDKIEVNCFLEFFFDRTLWTLSFLEVGGLGTKFFWSHQIWGQKFFELFYLQSALDWISHRGIWANLFWSCQIWGQKVFRIFSFFKCSGLWIFWGWGVQTPGFVGNNKFEVKKISEFFPSESTLHSEFFGEGIGPVIKFFWSP